MSNILEDQLDLNISSNVSTDNMTLLDPAIDYVESTFTNPLPDNLADDALHDYNDNFTDSNVSNISNTSNTTPELSSPNDAFMNYQYATTENYYQYAPFAGFKSHGKLLSFSLPDKLNLLTLQNLNDNSKSPSPEFIYQAKENHDDRTINPQELFTVQAKSNKRKSIDSVDMPQPLGDLAGSGVPRNDLRGYILPSSSSSPNLTTIFNPKALDVDFKMNNECFNAIKVWLNNNELGNANGSDIVINPTGIIKNSMSKRRNSIQIGQPTAVPVSEKRKRRKSTNSGSVAEVQTLILEDKETEKEEKDDRHDDEGKPFPCPECSKQFKRLEHLKRHIRSVHSNIRPFHCKYCEKQFSRSDNLAQHLKTHYKVNANGTTSIIYGNPNLHNRGGRRNNSTGSGTGTLGP